MNARKRAWENVKHKKRRMQQGTCITLMTYFMQKSMEQHIRELSAAAVYFHYGGFTPKNISEPYIKNILLGVTKTYRFKDCINQYHIAKCSLQ